MGEHLPIINSTLVQSLELQNKLHAHLGFQYIAILFLPTPLI